MTKLNPDKGHTVPAKVNTVAMWLFLASLAMLFAASMLGYVLIRLSAPPINASDLTPTRMPLIFFLSTLVVLAASGTVQLAVSSIRQERLEKTKLWLKLTLALATLFTLLQIPGLYYLFQQHVPRTQTGANLSLLIGCFIILHALHVLGGICYLPVVVSRANRGLYDHEHYLGIKHAALYWHFLDVVWIVMFGMMLILG